MKTSPVTPADLASSVIAVPPLARRSDLSLSPEANQAIVRHLESGGVRSVLYGGNANFYHVSGGEYPAVLDMLIAAAGVDTWIIPSVGPDYGKMMDQAPILRARGFPTAMVLPITFPATDAGVSTGLCRFAAAFGKPVVVYLKAENYLTPATVGALARDGLVSAIKYAIVHANPHEDRYLRELLQQVPANLIVSGIGERPAIVHLRDFGLQGFTSGSVCIGPRGSMRLLELIQAGEWAEAERIRAAYLPLEDCRDALSPIRVLHEAVTLAQIANTGPILPLLSNLETTHHPAVRAAATTLLAHDRALADAVGSRSRT
ncbi:MAG: dihydrodipicolinate synthase family protein [Candidatus Eisenbacteria bacterium]|nr:dihydrodipicolinate synthase family protein [Candidatus Eisenbacteria bacterium]